MNITNQKKIQHLYWRAGFGLSPKELRQKANKNPKTEAKLLINRSYSENFKITGLNESLPDKKMLSKMEVQMLKKKSRQKVKELTVNWIEAMSTSKNPLVERMMLFWHDHFACRIIFGNLAGNYLNTIRTHALGNFRDLVLAISKDPAMIRYLNNQQNKKQQPNENYARELMELFTLGQGKYTEQDIKAAARAFTGWSSNIKGEFVFRKHWHDYGNKTFMETTGDFDGTDIINIILARKDCAEFITTKVYKYFVNEKINKTHIQQLTDVFYQSDYEIAALMEAIFTSDWFYDAQNIGVKIKSPIDLLVGIMKAYQVDFNDKQVVLFLQKVMGQKLFDPPNVAGWPGGKQWIDNATLMFRLNLASYIFQGVDMNIDTKAELEDAKPIFRLRKIKANANPNELVTFFKGNSTRNILTKLSQYLLQTDTNIEEQLIEHFVLDNNKEDLIKTVALRLMNMPEYQFC